MLSIDERISDLLRSKSGIEKDEIMEILLSEGYTFPKELIDWALL